MAETNLKLVLSFDADTQCFKPAGHNLSADQAVNLSQQLTEESKQSRVDDQDSRHRSPDIARCRLCKKAAEEATSKHREPPASPEKPEGEAPAEESESE